MLGCAFSPRYARARERDPRADPLEHAVMNVALAGPRAAWAMNEHGRGALVREPHALAIGPSAMWREGGALRVAIDERGTPFGPPVRGTVRLEADVWRSERHALDAAGRHHWHPVAPCARARVELERPRLRFEGDAYHDANVGAAPLEDDFEGWSWQRVAAAGATRVHYDVTPRRAPGAPGAPAPRPLALALAFEADGRARALGEAPAVAAARTRWGLPRSIRADPGGPARLVATLEDAPFYARSAIAARIEGRDGRGVHETLSLARFRAPWVRVLVGFRTRRVRP